MNWLTHKISSLIATGREKLGKSKSAPYQPPSEPTILPRDRHPISRKNIDPDALKVLYRLHRHGYKSYLVGGSVRDLLLGKKPKDFDIGTDASPQQVKKLFNNSLIIGKRFRIVHIRFKNNKIIEVTTFRGANNDNNAENGFPTRRDNTFGTDREDAFRRDLTINALAYNIADFTVIDHVGGLTDLENRIIRVIGDPELRFVEDPVRMIRAIRHAARTGFEIEENTARAIYKMKDKILLCSPARIHEELLKDFRSGISAKSIGKFIEFGMLQMLFPTIVESTMENKEDRNVLLKSLELLDVLTLTGKERTIPFYFSVMMIASTHRLTTKTHQLEEGKKQDVPRLIQKHLSESLDHVGVSKKNIDIMRQLLFLHWKMYNMIDRRFMPVYLRRKHLFNEAFDLLGITVRATGIFPDAPWPSKKNRYDPLWRMILHSKKRPVKKTRRED
ncbi:MAG: polynucleotide adenylyltransferase PcnB [Deltaproteobacteria bacterium]|nr:polynucleotide adenylyltransferase PcnB [Candidatus Zymogenaceae bacterium]